MSKALYIPAGGMCKTCKYFQDQCTHFEFDKMKPIHTSGDGSVITVKCKTYNRYHIVDDNKKANCPEKPEGWYYPPKLPDPFDPVLAKLERMRDLGRSTWHEVVYCDDFGEWQSFESSTFKKDEKVVKWTNIPL